MDKLKAAKTRIIFDQPFFAAKLLRMPIKESSTDPTFSTNGKDITYNRQFLDSLSNPEIIGVLCHEVLHVYSFHHLRRGNRDPRRWNVATDYAINPILLEAGFTLPKGALVDYRYKGMSAEQIYATMPNEGAEDKSGDPQNGNDGNFGGVTDSPGDGPNGELTQKKIDEITQQIKGEMAQARQVSKRYGKLPAGIERTINEILNPQTGWEELLARFVNKMARNDYRWNRPNPRYISSGLYLPSLVSDELGDIIVAFDTSGSIAQKDADLAAARLTELRDLYHANLTVIYCDTQVQHVDVIPESEPVELSVHGGGGTDFRPPFEYVETNQLDPSCFVYLTDGECNRFPAEPPYPVLWLVHTDYDKQFDPPFGEVAYR